MTQTKRKSTKWTVELISEYLKEKYPWIRLIDGQEYVSNKTNMWFYCTIPGHGAYQAKWNIMYDTKRNKGCQCAACKADKLSARQYKITKGFVGVTTLDGHTILEHTGYQQTPSQKVSGSIGNAMFRWRCALCGNESTSCGSSLKKPGAVKSCGCQPKGRDTIKRFDNEDAWANSDCYVYIADVDGKYIKPGITSDLSKRAAVSEGRYSDYLFVSPKLSRCEAFAIEQNLLSLTADAMPTLDELPDEYFNWGGKTELRIKDMFSLNDLRWKFDSLYRQLQRIGWRELALAS